MNAKAANSDFRGMCFIRLIVQHIFIGAVFSFFVKKWLFYVIFTIQDTELIAVNSHPAPTEEPAMPFFRTFPR